MNEVKFKALAPAKGESGYLDGDDVWFNDIITNGSEVLIQTKHLGIRPLKELKQIAMISDGKEEIIWRKK